MSDLLILRLHSRIPYARARGGIPANALESIEIHRFSEVFDFSSPEGPEASLPAESTLVDSGILDEETSEPAFFLDSGNYLFRQEREGSGFDLRLALREYIRDAWWEGRKVGGKLYLRRVSEDGKKALQILCPITES
jgi:hypothetical protein